MNEENKRIFKATIEITDVCDEVANVSWNIEPKPHPEEALASEAVRSCLNIVKHLQKVGLVK